MTSRMTYSVSVSVLIFPGPKFWEHSLSWHQENGSYDIPLTPLSVSSHFSLVAALPLPGWALTLASLKAQLVDEASIYISSQDFNYVQ